MIGHVQVRRMSTGDTEEVRRVYGLFGWPLDQDAPTRFLDSPTDYLLVAHLNGQPCGVAIAHELRRLDGLAPKLFLYSIDTLPAFRQQGVARALIEELQRIGRKKGMRILFVMTNASNQAAMELYRATGGHRNAPDDVLFEYVL